MAESLQLDSIDLSILHQLKYDGRRSFTDIAAELGVSVGMVRNRYNRLIDHQMLHIVGWVDPVKSGLHAYARVVIKVRPTDKIQQVAAMLMQIPEVSFLAVTTGTHDLEVNLQCRTNDHLLDVMYNQIHALDGVEDTSTTIYLNVLKWASHDVPNIEALGSGSAAQKG